jgi:hypothetical protein
MKKEQRRRQKDALRRKREGQLRRVKMEHRGWVPVSADDVPLIWLAGGAVADMSAQLGEKAPRRHYASPLLLSLVKAVRAVAEQAGVTAAMLIGRLVGDGGFLPGFNFNAVLAATLKLPVEFGPVRANPDGTFDLAAGSQAISLTNGVSVREWEPATNERLRVLDSEARLGGPKSILHEAASMVLAFKEGKAL